MTTVRAGHFRTVARVADENESLNAEAAGTGRLLDLAEATSMGSRSVDAGRLPILL
jgi:hypothetical protein